MAKSRGISNVGLTIIVILVLLFLAGLGYATTLTPAPTRNQPTAQPSPTNVPTTPTTTSPAKTEAEVVNPTSLKITVQDAKSPWAFIVDDKPNPTVQLKKGEKITIMFKNTGAIPHDFTVEGLKAAGIPAGHTPGGGAGQTLDPGQEAEITFAPDAAGTFTYFCSVPGHKELGMVGKIIIQ